MLNVLPRDVTSAATTVAVTGALAGVALWLVGARFSRSIVTLVTVALGCMVGMRLPAWCGWGVDGMATGVLCAVVLGVSGFVYHRVWVAVGTGAVLALWAGLVTWSVVRHGATIAWPTLDASTTPVGFFRELWKHFPDDVKHVLPVVMGVSACVGVGVSILWPRAATVLMWSMVGTSLVISLGATKVPAVIPHTSWAQVALVALLVGAGAFVQWKLAPVGPPSGAPSGAPTNKKSKKTKSGSGQ